MRDPGSLRRIDTDSVSNSVLHMNKVPEYNIEDYDFSDLKEYNRYIFSIEKIVRNSFEYRELIKYLRENMDMNKCSFYKNVNNMNSFKIKIHLHHHPFSLYDIVVIVHNKRTFYNESLCEDAVAKEVMYLHYCMIVGLIPLSETVHELVHNNVLFVPVDRVYGNYAKFVELYGKFMTPDQIDLYNRNVDYSKTIDIAEQMKILDRKHIYVDATGEYDLPDMNTVLELMSKRIDEIRLQQQGI